MKCTYYPFILWLSLIGTYVSAQNGTDKIDLVENPVAVQSVRDIEGFFGRRMALNREGYIKSFPIENYVSFIEKRQHSAWDWTKAEQHGKWIESAYLSAIQSGDKDLRAKADSILNRIIASQEEGGYVGATAQSFRSPERPLRGMDAYELYFVIHAFITVYEETGNKEALTAAEKLCDYIIRYIGPGKVEFWPSNLRAPENRHQKLDGQSLVAGHSVHYAWEGSLLADPILRLYEQTGTRRYLDWSEWVVQHIDEWSGWDSFSRLDSVADGTLGVDQLQPYVHSHTFHMNFMGFLRLYRITGDKSLLRKVAGAWDDIYKRQMYITGGVSVAEHYEHDYVKPLSGNIVETCATMSWMQLTQFLLELTGDVKYADAMERLLINHVFAAQSCDGDGCRYHTSPNGAKPDGYFRAPDCCSASGHRVISLLPTFMYAERGTDFYVNQYIASRYQGRDFSFRIEGQYPESEHIELAVTSDKAVKKTLYLRMPSWCKAPKITVNGVKVKSVQSGTYLKISRKWAKGDRIAITFPMELQWVKREHHSDYVSGRLPGGEIMYTEVPAQKIPYALLRGPIVYALDMVWNGQIGNDKADLGKDIQVDTSSTLTLINKPDANMLGPVYQTKVLYRNKEVNAVLAPFSNIGQWYRPGSVKPGEREEAFSYAIWLY